MELSELAARAAAVVDEIERAVVGKRDRLELVLAGLLADGHVLLEDVPGLAKTLTARSFATVTGLRFARVQFTPDLLPSDVTGSSIWNQRDATFDFRPGPVFANVLLADEINRAPPKTQAALLEAMQERQVSIDGTTHPLEPPFLVLATQNPIEYEGTYPLPEAQLDRFVLRTGFGYPSSDDEWELLARRLDRQVDEVELRPVVDRTTLLEMQRAVEGVHVDESIGRYVVDLVSATRESRSVSVGSSPRGSPGAPQALALPRRARRPRLRDAGRREGGRGAGPRPPPRAPARALGAATDGRGRRARAPRRGADADDRDDAGGVTRSADARLTAYATVAAAGLLAALALRRAELALLATPFALLVALGVRAAAPQLHAWLDLDRERALEGEELDAILTVRSPTGADRLELGLVLPPALEVAEGRNPVALRLGPGEERELPLRLRCVRWATVEVGDLRLRTRDRIGLVRFEGRIDRTRPLRIYPTPEHLRQVVSPAHTQAATGSEVARIRAEGLEFADTRPFVSGDLLRSVNWRATRPPRQPRRQRAPSRAQHRRRRLPRQLRGGAGQRPRAPSSTPSGSPRRSRAGSSSGATASASSPSGASCAGSSPAGGLQQQYRLVDALLETGVEFSYAWKDVNVIPARTLPPRALVVAVTPLLDERSVAALLDLRGRGHDLVVLEVSPEPFVDPGTEPGDLLALRVWRLQRAELRSRFERLGVAVSTLGPETPLEAALEEVRAYRRHARLARR